jgi:hypothetical protein
VRVQETEWQRRREYGECTSVLVMNPEANGAEGLFNQALSNGLAAIVSHHWPGRERKPNGRVKSAPDLLAFLNGKVRRRGRMRVLEGRSAGRRWRTAIATKTLADGVKRTDPVRHGTGGGSSLDRAQIEALVKLDTHPSLRSMRDALQDEGWVRMVAADREARVRALAYVAKLLKEEWERRQDPDFVEPYLPPDPKERSSSFGADVCPVCDLETFVVEETDSFGFGIGAGTCRACGYTRTPDMAEDEAFDAKIEYELSKGD